MKVKYSNISKLYFMSSGDYKLLGSLREVCSGSADG